MNKTKPTSVDEYISEFDTDIQKILQDIRLTVRNIVPEAKEAIKYDMPTFVLDGNLVHFAAFKNHIGFYPAPHESDDFDTDLSGYKTGKGSIQFPLKDPIPLDVITKIVTWRLKKMGVRK
jgi:uncharacterized protein YdhG (YjbR/CyaY superfamily)